MRWWRNVRSRNAGCADALAYRHPDGASRHSDANTDADTDADPNPDARCGSADLYKQLWRRCHHADSRTAADRFPSRNADGNPYSHAEQFRRPLYGSLKLRKRDGLTGE